jgi:ketosteroid isomerase-like protein
MKSQPITFALAVVIAVAGASPLSAHEQQKQTATEMSPGRDVTEARLDVDPAAAAAVATVERFSTALGTGAIDKAVADLDPKVLILESGGVEQSRDEYLGSHAKADAAFLKGAHVTLKRRIARASGDLAWIASESDIHAMKGEEMLMIDATETMVLRRTADGWKIVHIHWSSRRASEPHTE